MEEVRQKSWFSRNWGWVIGGGCLTMIVIGVLVIGGIIYKVADAVVESEPYTHAYALATKNEKVIEFLGEPIDKNGMGNTKFNYNNGISKAELSIPIKGPKDKAVIFVKGEEIDDEWTYRTLYVKIDGQTETIDLLVDEKEDLDDL